MPKCGNEGCDISILAEEINMYNRKAPKPKKCLQRIDYYLLLLLIINFFSKKKYSKSSISCVIKASFESKLQINSSLNLITPRILLFLTVVL